MRFLISPKEILKPNRAEDFFRCYSDCPIIYYRGFDPTTSHLPLIIDKFVLDLRFNTGGNSALGTSFLYNLNNIIDDSGTKVYGLIGNRTFSSAVLNAADLKTITNGVLIGEPTGGTPNGYGNVGRMTLPNSKLNIQYSTTKINGSFVYKDTVTPDFTVETTFTQYKSGIDPVFEAVKKY